MEGLQPPTPSTPYTSVRGKLKAIVYTFTEKKKFLTVQKEVLLLNIVIFQGWFCIENQ